ncbi:MAG TPA: rhomboid family intramembrane serine protease [Flavisolibacter sp.]|jgi:membrane associated rhomboid family serine protease|nr:rhomboid family intramembrane serine protease [Flavisolibacter sp.]
MSYYQQQNRHRLSIGQDGNTLTLLIAINLVVFILLAFIKVVYYFTYSDYVDVRFGEDVFQWVSLPAALDKFIIRPWTLLTHMFVHDTKSVWHILANMLWLWSFGYILQDLTGNKKLVPVYIYGAVAGAVAYIAAYNLIPALRVNLEVQQAYGASAGVMAIAIAATTLAPGYRIFPMLNGGIPLWVITVIYLIIDLATIPYNNPGGHIAHIAGAAMGFLFITQSQRGRDWGAWMNQFFDWVNNLFNPDKPKKGKVVKSQLFYKSKVQPFKKTSTLTQQRVDELLDKINQRGYHSLTDDEKELLKRASKEDI